MRGRERGREGGREGGRERGKTEDRQRREGDKRGEGGRGIYEEMKGGIEKLEVEYSEYMEMGK